MRLALKSPAGAPRMVPVDGQHRYTDGRRWWPSATALVGRLNPYHGPPPDPGPNGPAEVGRRAHAAMEAAIRAGGAVPEMACGADPAAAHVSHLARYLPHHGDVWAVEQPVLSRILNVAGTVDLIAEYDGEPSVIDWKTKRRQPEAEHIRWHFVQAAIYAQAWREMTGMEVQQLLVIVSTGLESRPYARTTSSMNEVVYADTTMRALHDLNSEMAQ